MELLGCMVSLFNFMKNCYNVFHITIPFSIATDSKCLSIMKIYKNEQHRQLTHNYGLSDLKWPLTCFCPSIHQIFEDNAQSFWMMIRFSSNKH